MSTATLTREANMTSIASRSLDDFRRYLLDGDHWREGRRVHGEVAAFNGLHLHRTTGGDDEQEGAHQFSEPFLEFLEQGLADERAKKDWRNAKARQARVSAAIRAVAEEQPVAMEALRFYMVPIARRRSSVLAEAMKLNMSHDALRYAAIKGVTLVFEELGRVW